MLNGLERLPLTLWSDDDVVLVACLSVLIKSGGYARIEEFNGTQVGLHQVAEFLHDKMMAYDSRSVRCVAGFEQLSVARLALLAERLRCQREGLRGEFLLYREIHGPVLHKIEKVASTLTAGQSVDESIAAELGRCVPVEGRTLAEAAEGVRSDSRWLAQPRGEFRLGLESLIFHLVLLCRHAFRADFAMSRGMRSLPALIAALRGEEYEKIVGWELPAYFCCVLPSVPALTHFGGS